MAPTLFDSADQAGWIVIVGWRRFQHYRDRDPVWIKTYLDVLDRDEYLDLPGATRALLHGLWLLTARRSGTNRELARYERGTDEEPTGNEPGTIRADTRKLSRILSLKVSTQQLEALRDAGFIEITASKPASTAASKSLADPERPRARDRAPGEGERERENPPDPPKGGRPLTRRDLRRYTGCQATRGSHSAGHRRNILGTDKPPADWPHPKPDDRDLRVALARKWIDEGKGQLDDRQVREQLERHFDVNGDDEQALRDHAANLRRDNAGA